MSAPESDPQIVAVSSPEVPAEVKAEEEGKKVEKQVNFIKILEEQGTNRLISRKEKERYEGTEA